ncbi:hypothetical protein R5R35_004363 [Gryllus longicercus]|uniref:Uncharacterized protein n=1 Tax=Gryllus longicercus TaxID=2509291 RepID=A0AAN9VGL5_9ORTH
MFGRGVQVDTPVPPTWAILNVYRGRSADRRVGKQIDSGAQSHAGRTPGATVACLGRLGSPLEHCQDDIFTPYYFRCMPWGNTMWKSPSGSQCFASITGPFGRDTATITESIS